ncbi:MAG: hypothetical protein RBT68_00450 [Spirochaetia bacterium]|jgi:hypothetical protein|nr:hypothetical protein [Spirochaetia bacterium]
METLLRLLPPIRRTRGPRLYAADGRRFLDLWLDDGRDILGAAGRAIRSYAANASDKGLLRPYPGLYEHRLEKAVLAAWPAFKAVRFYQNEERALAAAARLSGRTADTLELVETVSVADSGTADGTVASSDNGLVKLRPFAPVPQSCTLALARLPCPGPLAPACLLGLDNSWLEPEEGDLVPAMMHYAAARAMASLAKASQDGIYGEELWKRFDRRMEPYFCRVGPYLLPRVAPDKYAGFFKAALEGGALVSPQYGLPSMVPPEFDDGELRKLAAALATRLGN